MTSTFAPRWKAGDQVRVAGQPRQLHGNPFWLPDLEWRVLTQLPDGTQQFVDCDELAPNEQLPLF